MAKKKKVRVDLRKNRTQPPRPRQWTRGYREHGFEEEATTRDERVRAKGDLSRRRTIIQTDQPGDGTESAEMPAVDSEQCLAGRVLRVHGLLSIVEAADGRHWQCTLRRVLRSLATDERNIVTTGDNVWITPSLNNEGVIERVEPRHGLLTRASRGREHVIVANVDQVVFVVSLVQPELKPHLIDRYLASACQGEVAAIVCLNKADLVQPVLYQPLVGLYSQLGIPVLLTSAPNGQGVDRLRQWLRGRQTVFSGQSGVGKSSLLNAIQPELGLRVREVSDVNQKGKHTTTTAQLIRLDLSERTEDRGQRAEDRGLRTGDSGQRAEDRGQRTEDGGQRTGGRGQRTEDRGQGAEVGDPFLVPYPCSGSWVVDTPGIRQFQLWDIIPEEVEGFFLEFRPFVPLCTYPDCSHTHEDRCAVKHAVDRHKISMQRYESYLGMVAGTLEMME